MQPDIEGAVPSDALSPFFGELTRDVSQPVRVGAYRIVRVLGEGGMGTVYLAEQDEPVRRQVAIKVLRAGGNSSEVVARFRSEQQTLAMMDHPNITHVYDAGTTESGRDWPYRFAMNDRILFALDPPPNTDSGMPERARIARILFAFGMMSVGVLTLVLGYQVLLFGPPPAAWIPWLRAVGYASGVLMVGTGAGLVFDRSAPVATRILLPLPAGVDAVESSGRDSGSRQRDQLVCRWRDCGARRRGDGSLHEAGQVERRDQVCNVSRASTDCEPRDSSLRCRCRRTGCRTSSNLPRAPFRWCPPGFRFELNGPTSPALRRSLPDSASCSRSIRVWQQRVKQRC